MNKAFSNIFVSYLLSAPFLDFSQKVHLLIATISLSSIAENACFFNKLIIYNSFEDVIFAKIARLYFLQKVYFG
jgi:hypothetical protein